jgi:hypothetical protein
MTTDETWCCNPLIDEIQIMESGGLRKFFTNDLTLGGYKFRVLSDQLEILEIDIDKLTPERRKAFIEDSGFEVIPGEDLDTISSWASYPYTGSILAFLREDDEVSGYITLVNLGKVIKQEVATKEMLEMV